MVWAKKWRPRKEMLVNRAKDRTLSPLSPELEAFGNSIRRTRINKMMSQSQLAKQFGIGPDLMMRIEVGRVEKTPKHPLLLEKLRIWVETNKSLLERMQEEGNALNDIQQLLRENKNGGTHTQ